VQDARQEKPHIVFVLADDLGYNGVGYTNTEVKTPTLDSLASQGVKLRSYYAAPICGPSRFSLLSGRVHWKSEAWQSMNFKPSIPAATSLDYILLPAKLKAVGYKTHMLGKWHLGHYKVAYHPQNRGFHTFYGTLGGCVSHPDQVLCEAECKNFPVLDLVDTRQEVSADAIDTSIVADDRYRLRAVELIQSHNKEQPMFLFVSFHTPHVPIDPLPPYDTLYSFNDVGKNKYLGMISNLDDNVEEIRKALVDAGMWENTLFIFASDNGANAHSEVPFTEEFLAQLNYPLKGFKGSVDEGGIKVPAFVSGGFFPFQARGLQLDGLTSITDWYATLTYLAGAQGDDGDSINNWKYISGEDPSSARTALLQVGIKGAYACIEADWKLVSDNSGVMSLFNLTSDPSEADDVSETYPEVVSRLKDYFEDASFKQFRQDIENLRNCDELGYTKKIFSDSVCPTSHAIFLNGLNISAAEFPGCKGETIPL
jgi:arylsulfatase A-like enzyme